MTETNEARGATPAKDAYLAFVGNGRAVSPGTRDYAEAIRLRRAWMVEAGMIREAEP